MQQSVMKIPKTNEWLEFISRLGLVSMEDARNVFLSGDYSQITDSYQRALYAAGRGKTLSVDGNILGTKMTLDEAQLLADMRNAERGYPTKDEVLAYIYYERAVFFEKFGERHIGLHAFRSAKRLAESITLHAVIDYQISAHLLDTRAGGSLGESQSWITYFQEHNMRIMHLVALRRLARYLRIKQKYPQAAELLTEGLELARTYDYPFMSDQLNNSYGYLQFRMGGVNEARTFFKTLLDGIQSRYLYATVLENLTLTYYEQGKYDAAVQYMDEAIEHCQKYEILSQIPDECLFMGDMQRDKLHHPEIATHYYERGAEAALKLAEHGFTLKGDRLEVVQRYQARPRTGYSIPSSFGNTPEPFLFTQGRPWKEINDVFQYHLIQQYLASDLIVSEIPARLDLKISTYYAIKRRLTQHGYDFDQTHLELPLDIKGPDLAAFKTYMADYKGLSWQAANERFEKEVIEYLFKQVGYQKTKLAETLEISYPTVLQKTRSLKQP